MTARTPSREYYRDEVRRFAGTTDASLPFVVRKSRSSRSLGAPFVGKCSRGRCIVVGDCWLAKQRIPVGALEEKRQLPRGRRKGNER